MQLTQIDIIKKAAEILGGWKELEANLSVSRQTIWNWQTGKRDPDGEIILVCLNLIAERRPHLIRNAIDRIEKKAE